MPNGPNFQAHWVDIDPERMARYETMFQWNSATAHFYDAARIEAGHVVGDFGCGPGHAAIEFAKWVGPAGHVHGFDINAEFILRAQTHAAARGVGDRITTHLMRDAALPIPNGALDRIVARNTLIYVDDPTATLREFRRALKPGGVAHAIEGDWRLTAVEPAPTSEWRALIEAAIWAWPHPEIGRQLHSYFRAAGFADIQVQVLTGPDMTGRLAGMIDTVATYARKSGKMAGDRIDLLLETIWRGLDEGRYLAISPQFVVTASAA